MFKPWQVILFLLVVVLAVVGFIFWYYSTPGMGAAPSTKMPPVAEQPSTPAPTPTPPTPDVGPSTDEGLNADLNSIDTQMKVVDTKSAAVDTSLTDKPVSQTE